MEREKLEKLYEAIKSDNEKLFTSFMLSKSDLNICFGRFPILSLCYLHKSYKIILKYEKYLMPISKFEVVPEYFAMYRAFKTHAKKSLKLYACSDKIIYPLEMLAVLDERKIIKQKYKFLFKNEEILQNVQNIYILNQKIEITATREKFECEAKKMNIKQKFITGAVALVMCVVSVFSFVSISFIKNSFGIGTEKYPLYISTASELELALKKGDKKYYVLETDIELSKPLNVESFEGVITGNDKTIVISSEQNAPLINNLSGKVVDVNFEFELAEKTFLNSFAILALNNTGIIQKCDFSGQIKCDVNSESDIFVAGVAVENAGTIDSTNVYLRTTISNLGETNAYLAGVAGKNTGVISNTKTLTSKFEADTVDLSGIAGENYGTISACENNIELDQISSKEWHPNCAGISMANYGTIENSVNNAKISAESTRAELPKDDNGEDGELHVYAGGIVCNNYKHISDSKNTGDILAKGNVSITFAGGIAAMNVTHEDYSYIVSNGMRMIDAEIFKSKSIGKITSKSEKGVVYAAGVSAINNTQVLNSGFEGIIDATTNHEQLDNGIMLYSGGVVGFNSEAPVQNCYAVVEFENVAVETAGFVKAYGGVIGYMGNSKVNNISHPIFGNYTQNGSGFSYLENNHYVLSESAEYAALGLVTTNNYLDGQITRDFEKVVDKVVDNVKCFTKHESASTIPSEVRIYG